MRNFKWTIILDEKCERTSVAEVPGGILMRTESWAEGLEALSEALCFVPDVFINEFGGCLELDSDDKTTKVAI